MSKSGAFRDEIIQNRRNPIYKNYYQLTSNKMLKFANSMMAYFDKAGQVVKSTEVSEILGAPRTTLDEGIK